MHLTEQKKILNESIFNDINITNRTQAVANCIKKSKPPPIDKKNSFFISKFFDYVTTHNVSHFLNPLNDLEEKLEKLLSRNNVNYKLLAEGLKLSNENIELSERLHENKILEIFFQLEVYLYNKYQFFIKESKTCFRFVDNPNFILSRAITETKSNILCALKLYNSNPVENSIHLTLSEVWFSKVVITNVLNLYRDVKRFILSKNTDVNVINTSLENLKKIVQDFYNKLDIPTKLQGPYLGWDKDSNEDGKVLKLEQEGPYFVLKEKEKVLIKFNQIKYSKLIENRMDDQENQPNVEEETLQIDMLDSKLQNENDFNDLGLERKGDWIFLFNKREDSKCENPLYFIKKDRTKFENIQVLNKDSLLPLEIKNRFNSTLRKNYFTARTLIYDSKTRITQRAVLGAEIQIKELSIPGAYVNYGGAIFKEHEFSNELVCKNIVKLKEFFRKIGALEVVINCTDKHNLIDFSLGQLVNSLSFIGASVGAEKASENKSENNNNIDEKFVRDETHDYKPLNIREIYKLGFIDNLTPKPMVELIKNCANKNFKNLGKIDQYFSDDSTDSNSLSINGDIAAKEAKSGFERSKRQSFKSFYEYHIKVNFIDTNSEVESNDVRRPESIPFVINADNLNIKNETN